MAVALAVSTTAEIHTYMAKHAAAPVEQNSPSGYHLAAGVTAQPGCTRCSAGAERAMRRSAAGQDSRFEPCSAGEFRSKAGLDSCPYNDGEFRSTPRTRSGKDLRGRVGGRLLR